eukprot:1405060-Rhodomonas_salina.1
MARRLTLARTLKAAVKREELAAWGYPTCDRGHAMLRSTQLYSDGETLHEWSCNLCKEKSSAERWWCKDCQDDLCYACVGPGQRDEVLPLLPPSHLLFPIL